VWGLLQSGVERAARPESPYPVVYDVSIAPLTIYLVRTGRTNSLAAAREGASGPSKRAGRAASASRPVPLDAGLYNAELAAGSQAFLRRTGVKVGTLNMTAAGGTAQDSRAGPPAVDQQHW
jgi:hypothetical protein